MLRMKPFSSNIKNLLTHMAYKHGKQNTFVLTSASWCMGLKKPIKSVISYLYFEKEEWFMLILSFHELNNSI